MKGEENKISKEKTLVGYKLQLVQEYCLACCSEP